MEATATKIQEWKLVGCPGPKGQGQRFFMRVGQPDRFYICDNSGDAPDQTDDGPLRIDLSRRINVEAKYSDAGVNISVPVIVERYGASSNCSGVTIKELHWLLDNDWIRRQDVKIDKGLYPLRGLMARIFGE
ncbi:hypothetical protein LCGC14_2829380, partial [marine sediment metagenome]